MSADIARAPICVLFFAKLSFTCKLRVQTCVLSYVNKINYACLCFWLNVCNYVADIFALCGYICTRQ